MTALEIEIRDSIVDLHATWVPSTITVGHIRELLRVLDDERAAHAETEAELEDWMNRGPATADEILAIGDSRDAWRTAYWELRDALELIESNPREHAVSAMTKLFCRQLLAKKPPGERP